MKVKFPYSETAKEHEVKATAGDYYILNTNPSYWSNDCFVAVRKSAVSVVEEVIYNIGNRFTIYGEEYILATVDADSIALISLMNGNRFKNPIYHKVGDKITKASLHLIGNSRIKFNNKEV